MKIEITKLTLSNCSENIDLQPDEIAERYGKLPSTKGEMETMRSEIEARHEGCYMPLFTWKVLNKSTDHGK